MHNAHTEHSPVRWLAGIVLFATISLFSLSPLRAQTPTPTGEQAETVRDMMKMYADPTAQYDGLAIGAGYSFYGDERYFLVHIAPQFPIGNFSVGLDGNLRIGKDGLRKEDFDETYDYLRWINFVAYGKPHDDIYARVGGLTHVSIGNGTIVSNYSNNSSYDERRVGLTGRLDFGTFGAEAMLGDIFRPGLMAVRPFVHPFGLAGMQDVWLLDKVELGLTTALDYDSNAVKIIPNRAPYVVRDPANDTIVGSPVPEKKVSSPLSIFGVDLAVPIVETSIFDLRAYTDYIKFSDFNDGVVLGARTGLVLGPMILLDLKAERSLFRNHFVPNYFNASYERDRFDNLADTGGYITKATFLADSSLAGGNGLRVGGFVSIDGLAQVDVNFVHLDNAPGNDYIDAMLNLPEMWYGFNGFVNYTRKNITGVEDVFQLDRRSLLTAKVSYPLMQFVSATVVSQWTFDRDASGKLTTFAIIEPRVDLTIRF